MDAIETAKQSWTALARKLPHTKDDAAKALRSQLFFKIVGHAALPMLFSPSR